MQKTHTILAFAHNERGVLNKLFSLIRKKRYNVETITAGHTQVENISRITITFSEEDEETVEQIVQQIQTITEVTRTEDVTDANVVNRELVLLKVKAHAKERAHVAAAVEVMRGRVLHVESESMIIEISGSTPKIENAISVFSDIGILGIARTGPVVMHRGNEDMGLTEELRV